MSPVPRWALWLVAGSLSAACAPSPDTLAARGSPSAQRTPSQSAQRSTSDADGDGFNARADCDDADAHVHPGAMELCDGVDQDCDGLVDNAAADATTWYLDDDGDGYGDPDHHIQNCTAVAGYVADDGDCADNRADMNPSAPEVCDRQDNDCSGTVDDNPTDAPKFYADTDGDGYGDQDVFESRCSATAGFVADETDCDDTSATTHPDADEHCDGVDEDCDGTVDDDPVDGTVYYGDYDGDGWPGDGVTTHACSVPEGWSATIEDCDDRSRGIHPGGEEHCDGLDQDCDGAIDEDAVDLPAWYTDADGDGYGDPALAAYACTAPTGTTGAGTDCNDADPTVHPHLDETCNGIDDDCSGVVDEGRWHLDADGDGHGAEVATDCLGVPDVMLDGTDCDDTDATVSPDADERCDELDDDCDGDVDEDAVDATTSYGDSDRDGYGDPDSPSRTTGCTPAAGDVANADDCNDRDSRAYPGATELCNDSDDDCDGDVDEDVPAPYAWYLDADGDRYGDPTVIVYGCDAPEGYTDLWPDCDDTRADVSPAGDEVCDGADNDCNGAVDDDVADRPSWYADADGDGYGAPARVQHACEPPDGYVADATDCNDARADTWPGAPETCDNVDQDCDGLADDDAIDQGTWYADDDGDGFGDPADSVLSCTRPEGYTRDATDCDDANPAVTACDSGDSAGDPSDGTTDGTADGDSADASAGKEGSGGCTTAPTPPGPLGLLAGLVALWGAHRVARRPTSSSSRPSLPSSPGSPPSRP